MMRNKGSANVVQAVIGLLALTSLSILSTQSLAMPVWLSTESLLINPIDAQAPSIRTVPNHLLAKGGGSGKGVAIALDQAVAMAERKYKGRALSATLIQSKGPKVYKVKILSNGRVSNVFVDAQTGDVFKSR